MKRLLSLLLTVCLLSLSASNASAADNDPIVAAQVFGKSRTAVQMQPDGLYICEAEEFQPSDDAAAGWRAQRFGENYYAATFANSFLSRKAFLGAPEQCEHTVATQHIDVNAAGRFLVLVRYEAAYRFETQFRVQIEQAGKKVLDRVYGARKNLKIWAFRQKLKTEVGWSWGAVENIVWEGHDVFADLQPGRATIRLIAAKQPEPAAKRNIDLVMLTTDVDQVKMRIEKENYLPLDGMLTQSGDVSLRVTNKGRQPLTFRGKPAPSGGNWQQHSPYWVHIRNWTPPSITVQPGKTSDWVEVGGTMDSLADGQWFWTGDGPYRAEFGLRNAKGQIEPLATFTGEGDLTLAADADTRYRRRLRKQEDVLYDLLAWLKKENPAPHGRAPRRTPIYASTFQPLDQGKHAAAVREFQQLFSLSETKADAAGARGYIDVRSVPTPKLEDYCRKLGPQAKNIAVVSLGDEIGLPSPPRGSADEGFRAWLKSRGLTVNALAANLEPDAKLYDISEKAKMSQPGLYYWSRRYQYEFGIRQIKTRTDILRQQLPNAAIGANFSPHYPQEHMYLGEIFKWVTVFRESGMTLPWSEDYIWQVAVGTPQMNNINLDLFRAANRHHPDRSIMYYVMPHMPNNTPSQWRRLFYSALGHGMKMVNLFEFRPVHVAYTENHVDEPEMYRMILGSFRELGLLEDIVQDGQVRPAEAALWFSETGDIWGDNHGSFAAAKRGLYTAIRHQQIPLDFVVEQDAMDGTLSGYKVLYLTDAHVSSSASAKIAKWVQQGGTLLTTAGAGMFDEQNRPNRTLRDLLGVEQTSLDVPDGHQITWIKQDLPFAKPIAALRISKVLNPLSQADSSETIELPVFGARSRVTLNGAESVATFTDNSPAVTTRQAGRGSVSSCHFLPSLTYYRPAIPMRPVDRGSTDDAMMHFLPTAFDAAMSRVIASPAKDLSLPVRCSQPLVESTIIESKQGVVIPLINWTRDPISNLKVTVALPNLPGGATLASGRKLTAVKSDAGLSFQFDLDVADALILR